MWKKLSIIVIIAISYGFLYLVMYKNLKTKIEIVENETKILYQQNELLKNNWLETLIASKAKINKNIQLFSDKEKVLFKNIIHERTLIVKISYASCHPCLERELQNIRIFEKKGIPIIILAEYPNMRDITILLDKYEIHSKAYLIQSNQDILKLDSSHKSSIYMFLINKDMSYEYLFFPVQSIDDMSEMYFHFIENLI